MSFSKMPVNNKVIENIPPVEQPAAVKNEPVENPAITQEDTEVLIPRRSGERSRSHRSGSSSGQHRSSSSGRSGSSSGSGRSGSRSSGSSSRSTESSKYQRADSSNSNKAAARSRKKSTSSSSLKIKAMDIALLLVRVTIAVCMLTHGMKKFDLFISGQSQTFPYDPIGLGPTQTLALAVFAEVFCSVLIFFGLFMRLAIIPLLITMFVIIFSIHAAEGFIKQELPLIYTLVYFLLLVSGPGKYSLDRYIKKLRIQRFE